MKKIGKILYLKPTKAEAELIEAERKEIFDLKPVQVVKKPKRKPYTMHWVTTDPYRCHVIAVTGDLMAARKELDREFKAKDGGEPLSKIVTEEMSGYTPHGDPAYCGRAIKMHGRDVLLYFPVRTPRASVLAHECLHAAQFILEDCGINDTNGEAIAYLFDHIFDWFFTKYEEERRPAKGGKK